MNNVMTQTRHLFDRAHDDGRVRIFNAPNHEARNPRGGGCSRCLKELRRHEGIGVDYYRDGLSRPQRRYICTDCVRELEAKEKAA